MTITYDIEADYIVVGAGSSGCVIANRLSADESVRVLLLEAGGDDRPLHNPAQFFSNLNIYLPAGFANLLQDPKVNWGYASNPEPGINGRVIPIPRGKVLGGSSSINGLMYVRGLPSDYDGWQQSGCEGWAWADVLPFFKKSERVTNANPEWQGSDGPQSIASTNPNHPVCNALLAACAGNGIPAVDSVNTIADEGVSYSQSTKNNGLRSSTADAYLHPVAHRQNLRVETRALVTRILFDGKTATGVEFMQQGRRLRAHAQAEVILSGGAINSPQLLQASGIGPAALLGNHGITPLVNNAQVGENLQDHFLSGSIQARLKPGSPSLNQLARGAALLKEVVRFAINRRGLLANAGAMMTGFMRSNPALTQPDFQLFAGPVTADAEMSALKKKIILERTPGLTLSGNVMRPESRGHVRITSSDIKVRPTILHNYLLDPRDQAATVAMIKKMRGLLSHPALADYFDFETAPGARCVSDAELLEFAKNNGGTGYHPVGTCRMGSDESSVVDPQLRVRGVANLRVADASIMPRIVSANTNAACIMIGEKAAELIRAAR